MRCSWGWLLVPLLAVPFAADAGGGKAGKAEKQLEAFEAGDREALAEAVEYADAAVASGEPDAFAWSVRGRTYVLLATNPDLPRPEGDPAAVAIDAYEQALSAGAEGAVRDGMAAQVPVLESTLVAALVNDVEGKQWADARARLELALRAHALAEQLAGRDPDREAAIRRLGVRVAAQNGDLGLAREHYAAFLAAAGEHDSGLAGLVARKLANDGDVDAALAFLAPLDEQAPDDERLLRTEVDLLVGARRNDEATARVTRAEERLGASVSGAFLAATLYAQAGAEERSRAMWERVVELDPQHLEGQVSLGVSYTALAKRVRAELVSLGEEATLKGAAEAVRLNEELASAWAAAERHLVAARAIDAQAAPSLEALVGLYEAQLEGIDEATLRKAERASFAEKKKKLDDARAALAATERP